MASGGDRLPSLQKGPLWVTWPNPFTNLQTTQQTGQEPLPAVVAQWTARPIDQQRMDDLAKPKGTMSQKSFSNSQEKIPRSKSDSRNQADRGPDASGSETPNIYFPGVGGGNAKSAAQPQANPTNTRPAPLDGENLEECTSPVAPTGDKRSSPRKFKGVEKGQVAKSPPADDNLTPKPAWQEIEDTARGVAAKTGMDVDAYMNSYKPQPPAKAKAKQSPNLKIDKQNNDESGSQGSVPQCEPTVDDDHSPPCQTEQLNVQPTLNVADPELLKQAQQSKNSTEDPDSPTDEQNTELPQMPIDRSFCVRPGHSIESIGAETFSQPSPTNAVVGSAYVKSAVLPEEVKKMNEHFDIRLPTNNITVEDTPRLCGSTGKMQENATMEQRASNDTQNMQALAHNNSETSDTRLSFDPTIVVQMNGDQKEELVIEVEEEDDDDDSDGGSQASFLDRIIASEEKICELERVIPSLRKTHTEIRKSFIDRRASRKSLSGPTGFSIQLVEWISNMVEDCARRAKYVDGNFGYAFDQVRAQKLEKMLPGMGAQVRMLQSCIIPLDEMESSQSRMVLLSWVGPMIDHIGEKVMNNNDADDDSGTSSDSGFVNDEGDVDAMYNDPNRSSFLCQALPSIRKSMAGMKRASSSRRKSMKELRSFNSELESWVGLMVKTCRINSSEQDGNYGFVFDTNRRVALEKTLPSFAILNTEIRSKQSVFLSSASLPIKEWVLHMISTLSYQWGRLEMEYQQEEIKKVPRISIKERARFTSRLSRSSVESSRGPSEYNAPDSSP